MDDLDLNFIRNQFPALAGGFTFFDNAGGTQVTRQVGERLQDYMYQSNVQLGASYSVSQRSTLRVEEARKKWAWMINARDDSEIIMGSSTTQLLQNLSRSLVGILKPGDEIIVTNCDHEANTGPWISLQKQGIVVRSWKIDPDSYRFDLEKLESLLTEKTKLVAFTHVSNILGTINPVKQITELVHQHGAWVCVDGVACAPHRAIDVRDPDVDFYVFSLYKVYGPHYSILYGKKEHLEKLPGINHFFIGNEEIPYKLQPGNVNYELSYATLGIIDYIENLYEQLSAEKSLSLKERYHYVFDRFSTYEESLSEHLLKYLNSKANIRIIGETSPDRSLRVPTISFVIKEKKSSAIPPATDKQNIGIRWGDFYARRLITDLGLAKQDGVVRVSMVHYNTHEEIDKLIEVFEGVF